MFACSSRPAKAAIKKTPGGDVDHIATLFSAINVSGNGELTLEEFRLACLLAIDDEAEIKRVFQTLDEDNSGSIDKSEFTEGFYHIQQQIAETRSTASTKDELQAQFQAMQATLVEKDADADKIKDSLDTSQDQLRQREVQLKASMDEVEVRTAEVDQQKALVEKEREALSAERGVRESTEKTLEASTQKVADLTATVERVHKKKDNIGQVDDREALFAMFDVDDGGSLSFNEFRLACFMMTTDEAEVRAVFEKIDTDNSGEVDCEEFKQGFEFLQNSLQQLRQKEQLLEQEKEAAEQAGAELAQELSDATATAEKQKVEHGAALDHAETAYATVKSELAMLESSKARLLEQLAQSKQAAEEKDTTIAELTAALKESTETAAAAEEAAQNEKKLLELKLRKEKERSATLSEVRTTSGAAPTTSRTTSATPASPTSTTSLPPLSPRKGKKVPRALVIAELAVDRLVGGIEVMKYNFKNNDKAMRWLFLSADKSKLCWGKVNQKASTTVPLKDITGAVFGPNSERLRDHPNLAAEKWNCFSYETDDRTLDFASAIDRASFDAFVAIQHLKLQAADSSKVMVRPGVVLWQIARMRIDGEATKNKTGTTKALANVLKRSAESHPDNGETPRSTRSSS